MEKTKDLLGVRKKLPAAAAAAKRRRKVVTPAKARGAGRLAKVIAAYLASDSYMYAPLVSAPPSPPPPPPAAKVAPSAAPPISSTPEKEVTGAKIQRIFASNIHCLLEVFVDLFLELVGAVCF